MKPFKLIRKRLKIYCLIISPCDFHLIGSVPLRNGSVFPLHFRAWFEHFGASMCNHYAVIDAKSLICGKQFGSTFVAHDSHHFLETFIASDTTNDKYLKIHFRKVSNSQKIFRVHFVFVPLVMHNGPSHVPWSRLTWRTSSLAVRSTNPRRCIYLHHLPWRFALSQISRYATKARRNWHPFLWRHTAAVNTGSPFSPSVRCCSLDLGRSTVWWCVQNDPSNFQWQYRSSHRIYGTAWGSMQWLVCYRHSHTIRSDCSRS